MTAGVTPDDLSRHAGGMASPRGGCGLPQRRPCRSEAGEDVNITADDDRVLMPVRTAGSTEIDLPDGRRRCDAGGHRVAIQAYRQGGEGRFRLAIRSSRSTAPRAGSGWRTAPARRVDAALMNPAGCSRQVRTNHCTCLSFGCLRFWKFEAATGLVEDPLRLAEGPQRGHWTPAGFTIPA